MSGDPPHGALFTHVAHADRSYHKIYPMYSSMLFVPFTEAHSPSSALSSTCYNIARKMGIHYFTKKRVLCHIFMRFRRMWMHSPASFIFIIPDGYSSPIIETIDLTSSNRVTCSVRLMAMLCLLSITTW